MDSDGRGQERVGRTVARDERQDHPGRGHTTRGGRPGHQQQRADEEELREAVLPERLAADHPGGGAEGVDERQHQREAAGRAPAQQPVDERRGAGGDQRCDELLHHPRGVVDRLLRPSPAAQPERGGDVERAHQDRKHHRIHRDAAAAAAVADPVRLRAAALLLHERQDGIERQAPVPQKPERLEARGVRVARTDRPQVRVVDDEAAEADQQARAEVTGRRGWSRRRHGTQLCQPSEEPVNARPPPVVRWRGERRVR